MKRKMAAAVGAIAILGAAASAAAAGEVVFGVGYEDVLDQHDAQAAAGWIELRSDPFYKLGPVELRGGVAGEATTDAALWGGAGLVATLPVGSGFRLEGSVMAGLYEEGDGVDLGDTVEFRSQIGLTYAVADKTRLGVVFEHKSNAGLSDHNPGVETLFVSVIRSF
jgi:hypothetical protein